MADTTQDVLKKQADRAGQVERTRATRVYMPDVDIVERADDIILLADVPGVDEASIDITLEKDVLTLYGKVEPELPVETELIHAGYGIGDFHRAFTLSSKINREAIEATVKHGVLKLVLPKAQAQKSRKISVKAEA